MLELIRVIGLPAALVAQDGLEAMAIDWDAFDVLFSGGSGAGAGVWPCAAAGPIRRSSGRKSRRRGAMGATTMP